MKEAAKYTPWTVSCQDGTLIRNSKGAIVAQVTNAANSDVLAAAPELLVAAKAFIEAWDKCLQLEKTDVALRLARAAIAKAEGTPPC